MNEEQKPIEPKTPAPQTAPPPPSQPAEPDSGGTADRSTLQSAYPAFSANQQSIVASRNGIDEKAESPAFADASKNFNDAITLVFGLASSICYILIYYWVKNNTITMIICLALSGAAIYFAVKNYNKTQNITPLEVIGLSAATITIVFIGIMIVTDMIIRSQINSLYR